MGLEGIVKPCNRNVVQPLRIEYCVNILFAKKHPFIELFYVWKEMIEPRECGFNLIIIPTSGEILLQTVLEMIPRRVCDGWIGNNK